jgi:hypothetical protein
METNSPANVSPSTGTTSGAAESEPQRDKGHDEKQRMQNAK